MSDLKHVVSALRREIDEALKESGRSGGARLEAERVTLECQIAIAERKSKTGETEISIEVLEANANKSARSKTKTAEAGRHMVTIEFKVDRGDVSMTYESARPAQEAAHSRRLKHEILTGVERASAVDLLASVFGAPGFDSSARATVFREAVEGLSEAQVYATVRALTGDAGSEEDGAVKRARHLIAGAIKSGPLRSVERGGDILSTVLAQFGVSAVVRTVAEQWKTQGDWLG